MKKEYNDQKKKREMERRWTKYVMIKKKKDRKKKMNEIKIFGIKVLI